MSSNSSLIYDTKKKILAKYPRFGSEIAEANIEFNDNLKYHTAATDGKNIYVDPNYFASLNENDRLFTIAHEIMHIKFMHMYRLKDKNGVERDLELWNIATDAIINANLERDGLTIKEGYVNMPEALNYSSEEFYQKLLKDRKEQKNNMNQEQNENIEQTKNQNSGKTKSQSDDHSLWGEAFAKLQNSQKKEQMQTENTQKQEQDQKKTGEELDFNEETEFNDNRKYKINKFKSTHEPRISDNRKIKLGDIGKSKEEIDWKLLLRREIEKTETFWSQRHSFAENNYAYRLEERDIDDEAETEVMLDISGSVDLKLIKSFLRQLKPLLEQSKLRVGCFNERFWEFTDIKNVKDIDNFTIPREARGWPAWTEDWDLAVRSFTKKSNINKIVFTDGYPSPGTMPKYDLKRENVIWLVYGNKNFKPCCGKVINITEKQLEQIYQIDKRSIMDNIDR